MIKKIKRIFHKLFGYKVEITFPDGKTEIVNTWLSEDSTVRAKVLGTTHVYLEPCGVVRGLWPNKKTKWKSIK